MTIQQFVFLLISAFTLVAAIVVVTDRNLFRAALALIGSFLGVAGLYVMLEAGFLAAAQILVYVGAIAILLIFAIMLTRRLMQTHESPFNSQPLWGFVASVLAAGLLIAVIIQTWPSSEYTGMPAVSGEQIRGSVDDLGSILVNVDGLVLPFEIASVLLLAALVGAIVIAWPEKDES